MEIIYLKNAGIHSGDAVQGSLLAKHLNAKLMSLNVLPGKAGVIDIDGLLYAKKSFLDGLQEVNPDIVFVHTITPQMIQELPKISQKYVMVMRVAINFEEIHSQPGTGGLVSGFWSILGLFDAIICPSLFVLRNLQSLGYKNVVFIPTAVDSQSFPRSIGKENNVLSVGRLGVIKNTITTLLAFSKVHDMIPDARMVVIGDGPHLSTYQELIRKLRLDEWIELRGGLSSKPYYQGAKVFVQSSFSENGSLTVLESLASGVPCVLSNIGGHHYENEAITYVGHDDVDGFADVMIQVLNNEDWKGLSDKAYIGVKRYDIQEVKNSYLELFSKLMILKKFKR